MDKDITGIILAGGKSRRMGGDDKGLVRAAGRPLVQYVADAIRPQVASILISANRNEAAYGAYGSAVVRDTSEEQLGPLAGVLSGLRAAATAWAVIVPCDAPFVPPDLVARLGSHRVPAGESPCVAYDGTRLQPAFALIPRSLAPDLQRFLDSGGRKLAAWLQTCGAVPVDFSDKPEMFLNINEPADIVEFERMLRGRDHAAIR